MCDNCNLIELETDRAILTVHDELKEKLRNYRQDAGSSVEEITSNWPPNSEDVNEPIAVQQILPERRGSIGKECDFYPIDPNKKGLVLHFYQTQNRNGWKSDVEAVRRTFSNGLKCEVREFKDWTDRELSQSLNNLEREFQCKKTKPYNYLIVIVAAHGGWFNGNYFKSFNGMRIAFKAMEDFFLAKEETAKLFLGMPKVIVWNVCRGTQQQVS